MDVNAASGARWVVFRIESSRYALPLASVERIVRAAQVTPLPLAPPAVLGALDVHGDILPVFDLRRRFRLRERALDPADHFLIARAGLRRVVLVIDQPLGVVDQPTDALIEADALTPDLAHVRGVLRLPDGLVVIQDLEGLLTAAESLALDVALAESKPLATSVTKTPTTHVT
jgi:purine-binding chemotaxis protein CheW